jgi:rhodanese-related sulfurtransferase
VAKRKTIEGLLARERAGLRRVTAFEAAQAVEHGAILVDTRSTDQQEQQGLVPCAESHPLSAILWRLDPGCPTSNEKLPLDAEILVICREGYSSSLAAAALQELGFSNVADVIGGVDAWIEAGLPVEQVIRATAP